MLPQLVAGLDQTADKPLLSSAGKLQAQFSNTMEGTKQEMD